MIQRRTRVSDTFTMTVTLAPVGGVVAFAAFALGSAGGAWAAAVTAGLGASLLTIAALAIARALGRARDLSFQVQSFSNLIENTDNVVAIASPQRKLTYLNRAAREKLGFGDADVTRTPSSVLYANGFEEVIAREVVPTLNQKQKWRGEVPLRHQRTGEVVPVQSTTFPLYDLETGEMLAYAMIAGDLRERRKLERQQDRFFSLGLDMLAIANLDGRFVRLNPAFTKTLGFTEAELCARPLVDFIHPDDVARTLAEIERQRAGHSVWSFENRYRTKAGEYRWLSWKSFPDGELIYAAARDITDDKAQAEQTRQLRDAAVAASRAKSEFLANMSHEIRTPINGVIGSNTLLLDTELTPAQRELAADVESSAHSLLGLINDILDFSKIEAGKLDIEWVDFDLAGLVTETVHAQAWALRHKSLPVTVHGVDTLTHHLRGDPGRVRQVLTNLLTNAIKFTAEGSIRVEIGAEAAAPNRTRVRCAVIDTGIGIAPEARERLFKPFTQADASTTRRFGGTGLGLSISQRLVQLMGGEMGVDSAVGRGSTFWFTLDLENAVTTVARTAAKPAIPGTRFAGASILVAEDNVINQKILLAMLKKMGFRAQAVANGQEVVALLHDVRFDLVLMDCQMPEMDGYEATARIRASQSLPDPNLPIIAMTANALKGDRERCLAAGMNDYATKPIDVHDLAEVVERWLERARAANAA